MKTKRNRRPADVQPSPDEALAAWYIAKQNGAFEQRLPHVQVHFELSDPWIPLMDLPLPKPCPFCGTVDNHIVVEEIAGTASEAGRVTARVECDQCGTEAPYGTGSRAYDAIREAAYLWNKRDGGES